MAEYGFNNSPICRTFSEKFPKIGAEIIFIKY
jgi:hypothetical protein